MASQYFIDSMQKTLPESEREIFNHLVRMGLDGSRFDKIIPNRIDMTLPSIRIQDAPDANVQALPVFQGPSYQSVLRQAWDYMTAHAADGAIIVVSADQGRTSKTYRYNPHTRGFDRFYNKP